MTLRASCIEKLNTCDHRLVSIVQAVAKDHPLIVVCGHRGKEEQNQAFARGNSKLRWPRSRHNTFPSLAVDLAPSPLDWDDTARFKTLADAVKAEAKRQGVAITWGGDWTKFVDVPHFEITQTRA